MKMNETGHGSSTAVSKFESNKFVLTCVACRLCSEHGWFEKWL